MNNNYADLPYVKISDADASGLFSSGLEYNAPARGMWNIVHMGMLIPDAHQIYVCAQGCLRGVILTAAEMFELDRLSWISVSEEDMFNGHLESDIVDGTADILRRLDRRPPVVLLFLSCIHMFAGVDFENALNELSEMFPDITFIDCYMTPTMRQTVSPVVKMNAQLYAPLKKREKDPKAIAIIGCDRPTDETSELIGMIRRAGYSIKDITACSSFEEYLSIAESSLNIFYIPTAKLAGEELEERFGTKALYLPACFDSNELKDGYRQLCGELDIPLPDLSEQESRASKALDDARAVIGDTKIAIDFTAVTRPFGRAKLLCEHGFNVTSVIADTAGEETSAFEWLKANRPDLMIYAAANVNMLNFPERPHSKTLAVGQKAAHYFNTDNFVNIVMNGGYYGFSGIEKLAALMTEAYRTPKDRRTLISHKGFGCASCLDS